MRINLNFLIAHSPQQLALLRRPAIHGGGVAFRCADAAAPPAARLLPPPASPAAALSGFGGGAGGGACDFYSEALAGGGGGGGGGADDFDIARAERAIKAVCRRPIA